MIRFKNILRAAAFACAITACGSLIAQEAKVPTDKSKFHVVVLMGQSNMEGAGYPVFDEYIVGSPNVLCMTQDMKWEQAKLTPSPTSGMSPGYVFARKYAELHPGITVGYIQCALGGRSLAQLGPDPAGAEKKQNGKTVYQDSIDRMKEAMKVGEIKAILWHQGETDSGMQDYVDKLAKYVAQVRKDSGLPELPFIVGELGHYVSWMDGYNQRIQKVEAAIPNCKLVSSVGFRDRGDELHFSSFGVNGFGSRYLMKYLEMKEPDLAKKFEPELKKIEEDTKKEEDAWVMLFNGDMSRGGERPMGWDHVGWGARGPITCYRDTKVFASAPSSLRLECSGGSFQIGTMLRKMSGHLKLTCKIKNEGCTKVTLSVPGSPIQPQAQGQQGQQRRPGGMGGFGGGFGGMGGFGGGGVQIDGTNAKDWTEFSVEFNGRGGGTMNFSVQGTGKAWLDDIKIEAVK